MGGIDGGDFAVIYTSSRVTSITRLTIGKVAEAAAKYSFRRACAREIGRFPQRRCPERQRRRRPCVFANGRAEVKTETYSKK